MNYYFSLKCNVSYVITHIAGFRKCGIKCFKLLLLTYFRLLFDEDYPGAKMMNRSLEFSES